MVIQKKEKSTLNLLKLLEIVVVFVTFWAEKDLITHCQTMTSPTNLLNLFNSMLLLSFPLRPDDLPRVFRSLSDTDSFQGHVTDEETEDGKLWRVFHIGEQEYRVDMAVVDPYKAVISHGGESPGFNMG